MKNPKLPTPHNRKLKCNHSSKGRRKISKLQLHSFLL
uniref:Uncharacterized protein n=1 Tax=Rhizophora mucronata TaxID=61149 RepID=A0A2P2IVK1_RHIMU